MTISKVLRKDRKNKLGECPIVIKIIINRRIIYKPTQERVAPENWDENSQSIKSKFPNARLINAKLDKLVSEIKAGLIREELKDRQITPEVVKKQIQPKTTYEDFYAFSKKLIESWKGKKKESTIEKYIHELSKIHRYAPNLQFPDITPDWLEAYEKYQREVLGNVNNTISRSFKNIKTFFLGAIDEGIVEGNPFKKAPGPSYKPPKRQHLTANEIKRFAEVIDSGSVQGSDYPAGLYFLFSCYTGLRYSDCEQFRPDQHIIEGKRILISMVKTDEDVSIVITGKIRDIITQLSPYFGRMPTNQECNRAVKIIARKAGIKKVLTFHCARHTFGYSCAEANVPIEVAAKLMGHSDTKTTSVYYHISNRNADNWLSKMHGD